MKKEQLKVTTMMRPGLLPPAPPGIGRGHRRTVDVCGRGRPLNGPKMEKQMSVNQIIRFLTEAREIIPWLPEGYTP